MKLFKNNAAIFIYALLSFLFMNFGIDGNAIQFFPTANSSLNAACIAAFLFFLYRRLIHWQLPDYKKGFYVLASILSAFFSFISVMGIFFSSELTLSISELLTDSFNNFIRFLLVFTGGFILFFFAIVSIGAVRERLGHRSSLISALHNAEEFIFSKKTYLKSLLIIALCWLPHLIIRYPGALPTDGVNSLLQYYGIRSYSTQHPIIYTQLLGIFCNLGNYLHNTGLGLFLLVLLQSAALLLVLAYTIQTMNRLGVPRWCSFAALLIFSIVPVFPGYATTLVIDVFYCAAILLLMNELAWYLFQPEQYKKSIRHLCLTATAVLCAFFRHNGFHVIAIILVFVAVREVFLIFKKEQTLRYTIIILACLAIPLCIGKINNSFLYQKYNATHVSTRATLALPLQQISRCVVAHGDEMLPEELASIHEILDWSVSEFRERYNPYNFDGIKHGFPKEVSAEWYPHFFKTWFGLLIKYPETCITATLQQNYCLFSPLKDNSKYYGNVRQGLEKVKNPDFTHVYELQEQKADMNQKLTRYYNSFSRFPFIGLYVNQGVMTLLLLGICLYALFDRNPKLLLLALPLLLTLAVTFVGPAAYGHPRYFFPVLYSMPLLFGLFLTGQGKAVPKNN